MKEMNDKPPLIIDKSFAHSVTPMRLAELAESYTILVPSAFFYEVARTSLDKRSKAIRSFPEFQMLHIPSLLHREVETGKPLESLDYQAHYFNPDFVSGTRVFDETEENIVKGYEDTALAGNLLFWKQVLQCGVFGFTVAEMEQVRRGTIEQFTLVCKELLNVERVRRLADGLGVAIANQIDERWLYFRYLQTKFIYGLSLHRSYPRQEFIPSDLVLEHDVHDLEYLTLGLHAEALATTESALKFQKIGWKFKLFCPFGMLLSE